MKSDINAKRLREEVGRVWHEFKQVNDRNIRRRDCINDATLHKLNDRLDSVQDRLSEIGRAA